MTTGPNRSVGEARRSGGLRDRGQLRPVEEQELVVADDRRAWSEMGRSSSAMGNRQWRESQEKSGAPRPNCKALRKVSHRRSQPPPLALDAAVGVVKAAPSIPAPEAAPEPLAGS
jgi:hypothetical protein